MQTLAKLPATRPSRNAVTSKAGVRRRSVQSSRGSISALPASWGPSRRESRRPACGVKMSSVRALLLLGVLVACGFLGLMLLRHRRPLRGPDPGSLRDRAVRPGHGRGPPLPVQRRRGAHHRGDQPPPHRDPRRRPRPRGPGRGPRGLRRPLRGRALSRLDPPRPSRGRAASRARARVCSPGRSSPSGDPSSGRYLYGSDIALFLFLALLVLDRWLAFWRDGRAGGFAARRDAPGPGPARGPADGPGPRRGQPAARPPARDASGSCRGFRSRPALLLVVGCSAASPGRGSAPRSRTRRSCPTTASCTRSTSPPSTGSTWCGGCCWGSTRPSRPIGFSAGAGRLRLPAARAPLRPPRRDRGRRRPSACPCASGSRSSPSSSPSWARTSSWGSTSTGT